jgi:hypothetical protein
MAARRVRGAPAPPEGCTAGIGQDGRVTFGSPVEWSTRAKVSAIVVVAVLLLAVGAASHARAVVEASYRCPVVDGDAGELAYSLFDPSTCTYADGGGTLPAVRGERDWLDPLGSALIFGVGAVVVLGGAALAVRTVRRRAGPPA